MKSPKVWVDFMLQKINFTLRIYIFLRNPVLPPLDFGFTCEGEAHREEPLEASDPLRKYGSGEMTTE